MLSKALKQDLRSFLPLWLFLSAIALGSSFLLGGSFHLLDSRFKTAGNIIGTLGITLCTAILSAYAIATMVFVGIRFYQNFYTDEGYLTFTLPVRRSTLFFSKVLSGMIFVFASAMVIFCSVSIAMMLLPSAKEVSFFVALIHSAWKAFLEIFHFSKMEFSQICVVLLAILIFLSLLLFSVLTLYLSITIGSVIAKKMKLFASIVTYYIIHAILSFCSSVGQLLFTVLSPAIELLVGSLRSVPWSIWVSLLLVGVFGFMVMILSAIYFFTQRLIEKKLNLP